jgi:hypothetical protein
MYDTIKKKSMLLEFIVIFGIASFVVYNVAYAIGKFKANIENNKTIKQK